MELVDLWMLSGEAADPSPFQPFPGNTWAQSWRQLKGTLTVQSLQLLLGLFIPHLGLGWKGPSGKRSDSTPRVQPNPECPARHSAHLATCHNPPLHWGLDTCSRHLKTSSFSRLPGCWELDSPATTAKATLSPYRPFSQEL